MASPLQAISAREVAASGLRAQRVRMNLIANNVANALTPARADGEAFRRQMAVFRAEPLSKSADPDRFGVHVARVIEDPSPLRTVFDPGHPYADADGYVSYPNVDLAVEMVDLVAAQRAYEANVAVIQSDRRMGQKALELIQG